MEEYKLEKDLPTNNDDGLVKIRDLKSIQNKDFNLERDLVDYIVLNIDRFTKDLFNDVVISFEVDKPIAKPIRLSPRGRRIDLFIVGEKQTYIIEAKNPCSSTESRAAIGQVLDYGREFSDSKKELVIITTVFDINTAKTINYYSLPIRYIYFSKQRFLEYRGDSHE